jgi:hypothetical protein
MKREPETWSVPWQALQRSLAERIGRHLEPARGCREMTPSRESEDLPHGWMVRARRLADAAAVDPPRC